MNHELKLIDNWFKNNKLLINLQKTNAMLITNPHYHVKNRELIVTLANKEIKQVSYFKYLGVIVDEFLSYKKHVEKLRGKIHQRSGLLWRIRNCINRSLVFYFYHNLIKPHFLYAAPIGPI